MFKVSSHDPRVLSWWISQRGKIDMDPPYQRKGRIWSRADKAYLVDSILNDFDIPKIYLADFTFGFSVLNSKKLSYAIIDGKQRFEAFCDFYDNKVTLNEDFRLLEDPSVKLGGLGYSDLKKNYPSVADKFDNFHLSVMRVITDDEKMISELFLRLNRSKPLTGAEIRNAISGAATAAVREIGGHEFFGSYVSFGTNRGEHLNAAAKFLIFEFFGSPKETKKGNLDRFTQEMGNDQKEMVELATRRVFDVMDRMTEIFLPNDNLLASAGTLPVYYWFVRNQPSYTDTLIREFIVNFERNRKANRDKIKSHQLAGIDSTLVEYDNYNRSTNDQKSHFGRLKILEEKFFKFIALNNTTAHFGPFS